MWRTQSVRIGSAPRHGRILAAAIPRLQWIEPGASSCGRGRRCRSGFAGSSH